MGITIYYDFTYRIVGMDTLLPYLKMGEYLYGLNSFWGKMCSLK